MDPGKDEAGEALDCVAALELKMSVNSNVDLTYLEPSAVPVEVEGVAQPKDKDDIKETEKSGEDGHVSPGEGDQVDRKSLKHRL